MSRAYSDVDLKTGPVGTLLRIIMSNHPLPPVPSSGGSGVRRHHTISASSRTARANSREVISEETPDQSWAEDEVVDQDWVGGVGAVGEKSSLHRQSSLPTRYHRG